MKQIHKYKGPLKRLR